MVSMMAPKKMKRGGERNKKLVRVKWRGVCVIWGGGGGAIKTDLRAKRD